MFKPAPARAGAALTVVLALLALPCIARAGTANVSLNLGQVTVVPASISSGIDVRAVTPAPGTVRVIADSGAVAASGASCTLIDDLLDYVECTLVTNPRVSFIGSTATDTLEVGDDTPADFEAGPGGDTLFGGGGADNLRGRAGNDNLFGGGGDDRIDPGTGLDVVNGDNGSDLVVLGFDDSGVSAATDGADAVSDSGPTGSDKLSFSGHSQPVAVTVNDGSADDGPTAEQDNVGPGFEEIQGTSFGDSITGSPTNEAIRGSGGDDSLLAGGGGSDDIEGNAGNDTVNSDDGVADAKVDCDSASTPAAEQGTADNVITDALDPAPLRCELRNGQPIGGGGPTGPSGPTGPTGPSVPTKPPSVPPKFVRVAVSPFQPMTFKFPDYIRRTRICGKTYCEVADIRRDLEKRGVHFKVTQKLATFDDLAKIAGKKVVAGEVLRTNRDGKRVTSSATQVLKVNAFAYLPSRRTCSPVNPFTQVGKRLVRITDVLVGMDLYAAQQFLKAAKCRKAAVDIDYRYSKAVNSPRVSNARIAGGGDDARFEVVVQHPEARLQLTLSAPHVAGGNMPPVLGSGNEIVLPAGPGVKGVDFTASAATANGIGFTNARVTVRDRSGELLKDQGTDFQSSARLNLLTRASQRYELFVSASDRDGQSIVGWKPLDAIRLDRKRTYLGIDGKQYAFANKRWGLASSRAATARAAASVAGDRESMSEAAARLIIAVVDNPQFLFAAKLDPAGGPVRQSVATLKAAANAAVGKPLGDFFEILVSKGVTPVVLAGAGPQTPFLSRPVTQLGAALTSDGKTVYARSHAVLDIGAGALALEINGVTLTPGGGFTILRSGGFSAGPDPQRIPLDVKAANFDITEIAGAPVLGRLGGPSPLVGQDGGTLIAGGVLNLVGQDGSTLVGQDGSTLVGQDGGSLLAAGGIGLVGQDGSTLVGQDGSTLVGQDGSTLVNAGGMNLLSAGGLSLGSD